MGLLSLLQMAMAKFEQARVNMLTAIHGVNLMRSVYIYKLIYNKENIILK